MADAGPGRVGIVGAGVAGLVAARVLHADGFDVTVFEKEASTGGVWCESRTYPGLRTNDPRAFYSFSDHAYETGADAFPTAEQVRCYLRSYAERFGFADRIRFGTDVVGVEREGDGWRVTVRRASGEEETHGFDFVVVCSGVFSEPFVPRFEGAEAFAGRILHSSELADPEALRGKRVVVVGSSKSGLDLASWAADEGAACTLVFRHANWMLPRYFFGWLNVQWVIFSRLFSAFMPYVRPSRGEARLHGAGAPLVRAFWAALTAALRFELRGAGPLVPEQGLPARAEDIAVGTRVYEQVRAGAIAPRRATIARFPGGHTVELDDGTSLEADVVVCATGFRQKLPFLEEEVRSRIDREEGFRLYRMILPPDVLRLGFLGYNASFSTPFTTEVAAHWLSSVFLGELALPTVAAMDEEIARVHAWAAQVMPRFRRGFFVGPFINHYVDDLMRDMGLPTRRAPALAEWLLPNWPTRYRGLGEERRAGPGAG